MTAIGDGNLVDGDFLYVIDTGSGVPSKKAAASTVYTYILNKLDAANRLVPALPASAAVFLDGTGAFSTPPNTTYSVFDASSTGLVPIGATTANHAGQFLRKDAQFIDVVEKAIPTTTSRPILGLIDTAGGGWATVAQPLATTYVDVQIYAHEHANGSYLYLVYFSCDVTVNVTGYDSEPTIDVSFDLSSVTVGGAPGVDLSSGELNHQYFPVIFYNETARTYWFGMGQIDSGTVQILNVATDFGGDGAFTVKFGGHFAYNNP